MFGPYCPLSELRVRSEQHPVVSWCFGFSPSAKGWPYLDLFSCMNLQKPVTRPSHHLKLRILIGKGIWRSVCYNHSIRLMPLSNFPLKWNDWVEELQYEARKADHRLHYISPRAEPFHQGWLAKITSSPFECRVAEFLASVLSHFAATWARGRTNGISTVLQASFI